MASHCSPDSYKYADPPNKHGRAKPNAAGKRTPEHRKEETGRSRQKAAVGQKPKSPNHAKVGQEGRKGRSTENAKASQTRKPRKTTNPTHQQPTNAIINHTHSKKQTPQNKPQQKKKPSEANHTQPTSDTEKTNTSDKSNNGKTKGRAPKTQNENEPKHHHPATEKKRCHGLSAPKNHIIIP